MGAGNETKVLLVDSNFSYGVLPPEITQGACPITYPPTQNYKFNPGYTCVIINGTVRNGYDEDNYICLSAQIYNQEEREVGYAVNCPFVTVFVKRGDTGFFDLYIQHDKQDIVRYDLSVNCISNTTTIMRKCVIRTPQSTVLGFNLKCSTLA